MREARSQPRARRQEDTKMMWKEFEEIAGYEVSYDTYTNVIEPMYMALPNVSKTEFVKMLDKKAFALPTKAQLIRRMRMIAQYIFDNCGASSFCEEKEKLEELARTYAERFFNYTEENSTFYGFTHGYAYHGSRCYNGGCTFPEELVITRRGYEYERVTLVKE